MDLSEKIKEYLKTYNADKETEKTDNNVTETVKLASNTSTPEREDLIDKIKDYNKEKERIESVPDLKFEEKTYTPKTDAEINSQVENELGFYYDEKQKNLENEKSEKVNNYLDKKDAKQATAEQTKTSISKQYDKLEQSLSNDAIMRGLQRSSIISEQVKDLGKDELEKLLSVDDKLASEFAEIDKQITEAENAYVTAVSELNFNKALETKEKVDKLKAEEEKKLSEVIEYNNKMRQEMVEANDVLNAQKDEELLKIKRDIVGAVMQYFYSLPKEERYEKFINDTELISLLGDNAEYIGRYLQVS